MSTSQHVLFLAGPPFSEQLWSQVQRRLEDQGLTTRAIPMLVAGSSPCMTSAAERVAEQIENTPSPVLVAHGSAIPIALRASVRTRPRGLVLTNGVLDRPDPFLRALSQIPHPILSRGVLRPAVWLRYLASSVGLRRAVINPYVMDRDMVVAVCGPLVETRDKRDQFTVFLKDLCKPRPPLPAFDGPTLLAWGDADRLYPPHLVREYDRELKRNKVVFIPGGQHLHPIERPWALADHIRDWIRQN